MKRWMTVSLAATISATLIVSGCARKPDPSNAGGAPAPGGKTVTLKIFQFKVEIAKQLDKMKGEYEKAHPGVKLQIESVGGGADYGAALKSKFASGDEPDIFNNGGYNEANLWLDRMEDLSDQPWVQDAIPISLEPMTKNGKIYGQPVNLEGYGFVYNKDLFAKAGITDTPKTLTQLDDAAKKLQASGITPFSNGYQEWWVLGNHALNIAMARQPDPNQFIAGLNAGTAKFTGNPVFDEWTRLLDLTLNYSNPNPLTTDYNTQVTLFASGKAAMMQQGNWTQVQINGITPNMNIGVLPMPINDDPAANDKLAVGVPNNWVVNKNSKNKEQAKEFLNWLVTSDVGRSYVVNEFKFIPAFRSIPYDEKVLGPIAADILRYVKDGRTLTWNWPKYPDGSVQEMGSSMQAYVAHIKTKEQMFQDFQATWDKMKK